MQREQNDSKRPVAHGGTVHPKAGVTGSILSIVLPGPVWAAGISPWEIAVDNLQRAFTGPIARGLSLVAIVVGGLMFAFGEGESKRMLAGIVFGIGMAIGAVNFMGWLFP